MKVFITGATGVLGRATVRRLRDAGHEVHGVVRSAEKGALLESLGAQPARVDVFDAVGLRRAMAGSEAVLHLATRIPPLARMRFRSAWRQNDRLRREGTERLMNAAVTVGARVFVQESITFSYADGGDSWLYETAPLDATGVVASAIDAERETARMTERGGRGVVLRFATFYGAGAASTRDTIQLARRRMLPIVGDPERFVSSIHVDDAAAAVVAALAAPAGIYNVADDEPLRMREYLAAVTDAFGFRPAPRAPAWLARAVLGAPAPILLRSQRVANKLLRSIAGWAPVHTSARDGWREIAGEARAA
jgi:2-alkyl-3-oxoalkanoate reductase